MCLFFSASWRETSSLLFLLTPIYIFWCGLAIASLSSIPLVNKDSRLLLPSLIEFSAISIPNFIMAKSLSILLGLSYFFSCTSTLMALFFAFNSCFLFTASSYVYKVEHFDKPWSSFCWHLYLQPHLSCLNNYSQTWELQLSPRLYLTHGYLRDVYWLKPLSGSALPCERTNTQFIKDVSFRNFLSPSSPTVFPILKVKKKLKSRFRKIIRL